MISYNLILVCSYSILLSVIIGLIRFRKIYRAYQPFIYITTVALINEIASTILISQRSSNAISVNVFNLVQCLLWFWQFKKWNGFFGRPWQFTILTSIMATIWIFENLVMGKIITFSSVFAVAFSFCVIFLAIDQVNLLIVQEKKNLLKNSKFLICTGVIIFYTYKIMIESFYIFNLDQSDRLLSNIYYILVFVNLFVNLLYALASLWIPTRQRFILPS